MSNQMTDPARKKLLYLAMHRGFKEADILLGRFAEQHLPGMNETQLEEFERLLQMPDHDLYAWITDQKEVPANLEGEVMTMLRGFSPLV